MLSDPQGIRFLIAMSFTLNFTQKQIESEIKDIDRFENVIVIGDDILRGITKERAWDTKHKLFTHVYYNASAALADRDKLYAHVIHLMEEAQLDPEHALTEPESKKYLIIRKSDKHALGYTINPREDMIEKTIAHSGWLILTSNHIMDTKEAISIYRAKDVVEKGFQRMKNALDLHRLRVHSDLSMQNKVFIGFIALILMSRIHKVMLTNGLYNTMSMHKLLTLLAALRVQYIAGTRILYSLTKLQKDIFKAFHVPEPL
jgi:transposase